MRTLIVRSRFDGVIWTFTIPPGVFQAEPPRPGTPARPDQANAGDEANPFRIVDQPPWKRWECWGFLAMVYLLAFLLFSAWRELQERLT